jgi:hypothetical protein
MSAAGSAGAASQLAGSGSAGMLAGPASCAGAAVLAEMCDGVDNHCDGRIDEGLSQSCGSPRGGCKLGTQPCFMGQWGACTGGVLPAAAICDSALDDRCTDWRRSNTAIAASASTNRSALADDENTRVSGMSFGYRCQNEGQRTPFAGRLDSLTAPVMVCTMNECVSTSDTCRTVRVSSAIYPLKMRTTGIRPRAKRVRSSRLFCCKRSRGALTSQQITTSQPTGSGSREVRGMDTQVLVGVPLFALLVALVGCGGGDVGASDSGVTMGKMCPDYHYGSSLPANPGTTRNPYGSGSGTLTVSGVSRPLVELKCAALASDTGGPLGYFAQYGDVIGKPKDVIGVQITASAQGGKGYTGNGTYAGVELRVSGMSPTTGDLVLTEGGAHGSIRSGSMSFEYTCDVADAVAVDKAAQLGEPAPGTAYVVDQDHRVLYFDQLICGSPELNIFPYSSSTSGLACRDCAYYFSVGVINSVKDRTEGRKQGLLEFNYFWRARTHDSNTVSEFKRVMVDVKCDEDAHGTFQQEGGEGYRGAFHCPPAH